MTRFLPPFPNVSELTVQEAINYRRNWVPSIKDLVIPHQVYTIILSTVSSQRTLLLLIRRKRISGSFDYLAHCHS